MKCTDFVSAGIGHRVTGYSVTGVSIHTFHHICYFSAAVGKGESHVGWHFS